MWHADALAYYATSKLSAIRMQHGTDPSSTKLSSAVVRKQQWFCCFSYSTHWISSAVKARENAFRRMSNKHSVAVKALMDRDMYVNDNRIQTSTLSVVISHNFEDHKIKGFMIARRDFHGAKTRTVPTLSALLSLKFRYVSGSIPFDFSVSSPC